MSIYGLQDVKRIYFIGIGGVSMSALAKLCATLGYAVSGSDDVRGEQTKDLAFYGIEVYIGADKTRKDLRLAELVVYTDAIPEMHEERLQAKSLHKRMMTRGELLGLICGAFSNVIAVAGSHGKTTCTSMTAHVLRKLGVPFTAHIGGEDSEFGNFHYMGKEYLVTEACEYKKNLLQIRANRAIVLNIDNDHMECYNGTEDLIDTFKRYCEQAKNAFVCADDARCMRLGDYATFGITSPLADYRAVDFRANGEKYAFTVEEYGRATCRVRLNAIGKCAVYNALAGYAVMRSYGFDGREIAKGLADFQAVRRRFEKVGVFHGASFICDYAHHPKEISTTVQTAKGICKGKLFVVFQPHTYSRTRLLIEEFVSVLSGLDELMIYKTFPAREAFDEAGSAETLAKRIGALYAENVYVLKTWLRMTVKEGDVVLFLGAGDVYYVAQYLLRD